MKNPYKIIWHKSIDSTNEEAARHISEFDNLTVIAADYQTSGRGQRGNKWLSASGENLTCSIILKPGQEGTPAIQAKDQFIISKITTLSIIKLLQNSGIDAKIKWPNDIYHKNKKICGILIENAINNNTISHSIIGIGLNINQENFPPELINPTSIKKIISKTYSPHKIAESLVSILTEILSLPYDIIDIKYNQMLYRKDEQHLYRDCKNNTTFKGKIKGTDQEGLLIIETVDGSLKKFSFKEISYII